MSVTIDGTNGITSPAAVLGSPLAKGSGGTGTNASPWPVFSAVRNTAQAIPNGLATKVQCDSEIFDLAATYDSTTNYRFQPTVAGYYQINGSVDFAAGSGTATIYVYKNGGKNNAGSACPIGSVANACQVSALIYMNGTSDYLELWCYQSSGGALNTAAGTTSFNGSLVTPA